MKTIAELGIPLPEWIPGLKDRISRTQKAIQVLEEEIESLNCFIARVKGQSSNSTPEE